MAVGTALHGGHNPSAQWEEGEGFALQNKVTVNPWQTRATLSDSSASPLTQPLPLATNKHARKDNCGLISCSSI